MPKPKSDEELQKHTLNLYQGDMDELRRLFPGVEPSIIIRKLVRSCIENARGAPPELNLDIPTNL